MPQSSSTGGVRSWPAGRAGFISFRAALVLAAIGCHQTSQHAPGAVGQRSEEEWRPVVQRRRPTILDESPDAFTLPPPPAALATGAQNRPQPPSLASADATFHRVSRRITDAPDSPAIENAPNHAFETNHDPSPMVIFNRLPVILADLSDGDSASARVVAIAGAGRGASRTYAISRGRLVIDDLQPGAYEVTYLPRDPAKSPLHRQFIVEGEDLATSLHRVAKPNDMAPSAGAASAEAVARGPIDPGHMMAMARTIEGWRLLERKSPYAAADAFLSAAELVSSEARTIIETTPSSEQNSVNGVATKLAARIGPGASKAFLLRGLARAYVAIDTDRRPPMPSAARRAEVAIMAANQLSSQVDLHGRSKRLTDPATAIESARSLRRDGKVLEAEAVLENAMYSEPSSGLAREIIELRLGPRAPARALDDWRVTIAYARLAENDPAAPRIAERLAYLEAEYAWNTGDVDAACPPLSQEAP